MLTGRQRYLEPYLGALSQSVNLETHRTWPNGRSAWLEARADPLPSGGLAVFNRDITERVESRERWQASQLHYASAFENAAVGMAEVALDGHWLHVNATLCAIVGYPKEELLARTFQDITHPEDLDADVQLFARLQAGEIPSYAIEKRYFRRDDSVVPVDLTVGLARDPGGAPLYAISVIEDITVRKRTEAELR